MIELKAYGAKTEQGPFLNVNEDNFDLDLVHKLFMIFDGFGGVGVGDKLTDELKIKVKEYFLKVGGDADATMPFFYSNKYLVEGNALINAFHVAHKYTIEKNSMQEMSKRGGASLLAAAVADSIMTIVSTGNCASFVYRNGELALISAPDNFNFCSLEKSDANLKTFPLSGIGLFDDLHLQVKEIKIRPHDIFCFLSDGAYSHSTSSEIKYLMNGVNKDCYSFIDSLFSLVNERGNLDNQTAMLLRF